MASASNFFSSSWSSLRTLRLFVRFLSSDLSPAPAAGCPFVQVHHAKTLYPSLVAPGIFSS
jgi:hypothetical protein